MNFSQQSVNEIIKVVCKEDPELASRLHNAVGDLMNEGFHGAAVGQLYMAFQTAMFPWPKMTQREMDERQQHMDEAAGM